MKGNEKLIGVVIGVVISIVAAVLGLQTDAIKGGICSGTTEVSSSQ